MAVLHAQEGCNVVGPAGMIRGTVRSARDALDEAGYHWIGVMPHMIFRSPFYYLYRNIMRTDAGGISRTSFQLDPFLFEDAKRSLIGFEEEGASALLTEPGLFILDLVPRLRNETSLPIACFSVSGEYELLRHGSSDPNRSIIGLLEYCRAAKRGGCTFVATHGAMELAQAAQKGQWYHAN